MKGKGCYADGGPLKLHWRKVSNEERGLDWNDFLQEIEKFPKKQLWRHNQAGDLTPSCEDPTRIDKDMLFQLIHANKGRKGFTYTHYDVSEPGYVGDWNKDAVHQANARGFTVNLSADSIEEADKLVALGIAPVTVLLPSEITGKSIKTTGGNKVITCPAAIKDTVSCDKCALCYKADRKYIIGFPAHGARKSTVDRFLSIME